MVRLRGAGQWFAQVILDMWAGTAGRHGVLPVVDDNGLSEDFPGQGTSSIGVTSCSIRSRI